MPVLLALVVLAAALLGGCGGGAPRSSGAGACVTAAGDGPGPLLVEERTERPQIAPYARRVTTGGEFYELTDTRVVMEGGETRFEPQPLEWRKRWDVPPAEMARLEEAVRASGILDAPAEVVPHGTSIGGSDVTWSVCVDGREHRVVLRGAPDARLDAAATVKAALDRALQAGADAARGG